MESFLFFLKNMFFEGQGEKPRGKIFWAVIMATIFFIIIDIAIASFLVFEKIHSGKIYPGVCIGEIAVGGKTRQQARQIIEEKINDFNRNGSKFYFEDKETFIFPIISSFSGDLAREIIAFKIDKTVEDAYDFGRDGGFWRNFKNKLFSRSDSKKIFFSFTADEDEIKGSLKKYFSSFEQPAADAALYATSTPNYWKEEIIFKISEEKSGWGFDYDRALADFEKNLSALENNPVAMSVVSGRPKIKKNECQNIEVEAGQFLDKAELTFFYGEKKWPVAKTDIADWLTLARGIGDKVVIDLNNEKITEYLKEKVSADVDISPINARFEIKDGRVVEFASSRDGQAVDYDKTIARLRSDFLASSSTLVEIIISPVKSEIKVDGVNNLGIKEIIGTGHSNFSGSSKNRIHNIETGAAAINGTLVAPGEEFSTNKTLGEVTAETGYVAEMVIKGNETIPEYGGGLCQVGTTLFRAALESGLPVTARKAHSYRVSYYEPAGTDATIYGPWPDLRFVNDTDDYILVQSRIDGNDVYFDFWGTEDGRIVEKTDPVIYNIVKPGATKIIETTDLNPGQKKCTERAHNGADAYFDYKVTYASGEVKEERFSSHYVPWQEVCLVGVEKISTSTLEMLE